MLRLILFVLLLLNATNSFCQTTKQQQELDSLLAQRKYDTARLKVSEWYQAAPTPELLVTNTYLHLDYFVKSLSHRLFSFKDLEPGEEIMDLRANGTGSYGTSALDPESALKEGMQTFPSSPEIPLALGYFYYDVYRRYEGRWFSPNDTLLAWALKYSKQGIEKGAAIPPDRFYAFGEIALLAGDYSLAEKLYTRFIESYPDSGAGYYHRAIAYRSTEAYEKCVGDARAAQRYYEEPYKVADAAMQCGTCLLELGQVEEAESKFEESFAIDQTPIRSRLDLPKYFLWVENPTRADEVAELLLIANPENSPAYQLLFESYNAFEQTDRFIGLLHKWYENQNNPGGMRMFSALYLGFWYWQLKEETKAKKWITAAHQLATLTFGQDSVYAKDIQQMLDQF